MEDPSEEELPELVRLETNSEPTQAFNLSTEVFETTGDVVRRDSTIEEKPVPVTLITGREREIRINNVEFRLFGIWKKYFDPKHSKRRSWISYCRDCQ